MRIGSCCIAALLAMPGVFAADAEPRFDAQRLFTTAAQREHLDAVREGTSPPGGTPDGARAAVDVPPPRKAPPARTPPSVALQGFVRRSDGRSVAWANGESTLGGERLADDIRVHSGRIDGTTVVITLPDGRDIRLEPGQVWDPDTGRVVDGYRR